MLIVHSITATDARIIVMRTDQLVAHRGYACRYPENTLIAIEAAIDAGARYVEIDVQLSADGTPMLLHDRTLERMCAASGGLHDHDTAYLSQLNAAEVARFGDRYAHNRLATLASVVQLLEQHPAVTLFVEIKRIALEHNGIETVLDTVLPLLEPIHERAIPISFSYECMLQLRKRGWPSLGVVLDKWADHTLPVMDVIRPDYIFADVNDLPAEGPLDLAPAHLVIYEIDDLTQARALIARGASFIESFDTGAMITSLDTYDPGR